MESYQGDKLHNREIKLQQFVASVLPQAVDGWQPLVSDAGHRRYYRLSANGETYIAVNAPPLTENLAGFMHVSQLLRNATLNVPTIFAQDEKDGFFLIEDFGDGILLKILATSTIADATALYEQILSTLITLQQIPPVGVPPFTKQLMQSEWQLHQEWFVREYLQWDLNKIPAAVHDEYDLLVKAALAQPQVLMHRDFHAANLMMLKNNEIGILDYQDAFCGPITYDLASLLRDCYIDWPPPMINQLLEFYHQQSPQLKLVNKSELITWFDWMGLQRHIKALLTFGRKAVRDRDLRFVAFIPRTLHYICEISGQYPELLSIHAFYRSIQQQVEKLPCAQ